MFPETKRFLRLSELLSRLLFFVLREDGQECCCSVEIVLTPVILIFPKLYFSSSIVDRLLAYPDKHFTVGDRGPREI